MSCDAPLVQHLALIYHTLFDQSAQYDKTLGQNIFYSLD